MDTTLRRLKRLAYVTDALEQMAREQRLLSVHLHDYFPVGTTTVSTDAGDIVVTNTRRGKVFAEYKEKA